MTRLSKLNVSHVACSPTSMKKPQLPKHIVNGRHTAKRPHKKVYTPPTLLYVVAIPIHD